MEDEEEQEEGIEDVVGWIHWQDQLGSKARAIQTGKGRNKKKKDSRKSFNCQESRERIRGKKKKNEKIPVEQPERINTKTRDDPGQCKDSKQSIAGSLPLDVLHHLGRLEEHIRAVVYDEDQRPDSDEVARPREDQKEDGNDVVDEHFPKVLPLNILEDGEEERPIEAERQHVVPPNVIRHSLWAIGSHATVISPQFRKNATHLIIS